MAKKWEDQPARLRCPRCGYEIPVGNLGHMTEQQIQKLMEEIREHHPEIYVDFDEEC